MKCKLCSDFNPPPVREALPNDTLCAECRENTDEWDRDGKLHQEENHQEPWDHDCWWCSMSSYTEAPCND